MRLIDVDLFMQNVRKELNCDEWCCECVRDNLCEIYKMTLKQPTAFDLENVIKQLKELKIYKLNMADEMSELMNKDKLGNYVCLEDVIEILKSAANATNGKNGGL